MKIWERRKLLQMKNLFILIEGCSHYQCFSEPQVTCHTPNYLNSHLRLKETWSIAFINKQLKMLGFVFQEGPTLWWPLLANAKVIWKISSKHWNTLIWVFLGTEPVHGKQLARKTKESMHFRQYVMGTVITIIYKSMRINYELQFTASGGRNPLYFNAIWKSVFSRNIQRAN